MVPEDVACLLDLVGLKPVFVEGLGVEASLVADCDVVLIRAGLGEDDVRSVSDWALAEAASLLA